MSQTKLGSFVESWANIAVGFSINFAANLVILPAFGFTGLTLGNNFIIGVIYTGISLVRSFVIRRWFNGLKFGNVANSRHSPTIVANTEQSGSASTSEAAL